MLGGKLKTFKPVLTYTAVWEPTNGFIHFDSLFPHIAYGFRNRTIPIAVYHVSYFQLKLFIERVLIDQKKNIFKLNLIESSMANCNLQRCWRGDINAWHHREYSR